MYNLVYKTVQNYILEKKKYFRNMAQNVQNGIRLGL